MAFEKSQVKHIIFDMDGTLLDTMPGLVQAYCEQCHADFGIPHDATKTHILETTGKQYFDVMRSLLQMHNIAADITDVHLQAFRERIFGTSQLPFPDVVPVLEALSKKYTLSISSGASQSVVEQKLTLAGIRNYFQFVMGHADDHRYTKGVRHIELFKERFSLDTTKDVVFVGDGRLDMEIAKAGNMFAVGRIGTFSEERLKEFGADLVVSDLNEFVRWLER